MQSSIRKRFKDKDVKFMVGDQDTDLCLEWKACSKTCPALSQGRNRAQRLSNMLRYMDQLYNTDGTANSYYNKHKVFFHGRHRSRDLFGSSLFHDHVFGPDGWSVRDLVQDEGPVALHNVLRTSPCACKHKCDELPDCNSFSYGDGHCWLKQKCVTPTEQGKHSRLLTYFRTSCGGPRESSSVRTTSQQSQESSSVSTTNQQPIQCSARNSDCRKTKCCSEPGQTCYEKDKHWAMCLGSCTPGIYLEDPLQYRTPWTCKNLGAW